MPLVYYPDPRLAQKAEARPLDDGLRAIGRRLLETAAAANAYGLAAIHIGALAPVVVVSMATDEAVRDYQLLYSPLILGNAPELELGPEGSVSMPGVVVEIARPAWVAIDYDDEDGVRRTRRLEGMPARIAQHEIDQMNGVFFLERLSRLKREMVLKKWKKRGGDAAKGA